MAPIFLSSIFFGPIIISSLFSGKADREFQGLVDCFYKIAKSDGVFGLYRGFVSSLQYIFLYRSVYYGLFDFVKGNFEQDGKELGFLGAFSIGQVRYFVF